MSSLFRSLGTWHCSTSCMDLVKEEVWSLVDDTIPDSNMCEPMCAVLVCPQGFVQSVFSAGVRLYSLRSQILWIVFKH